MKPDITDIQLKWMMFVLCLVMPTLAIFELIGETEIWFVGVEKKARIVSLSRTAWSKSSGTIYIYEMDLDGKQQKFSSTSRLENGRVLNVLVHPFYPEKFTVGSKDQSLFRFLIQLHGADRSWRSFLYIFGLVAMIGSPFVGMYFLFFQGNKKYTLPNLRRPI